MRCVWAFLICLLVLQGCSCGSGGTRGAKRIGVDANWAPMDFGQQQSYVNGFVEDLLLEVARHSGVEFEKVSANSDSIFEGLKSGKYEAILSPLPRYEFNLAQYDFSQNFLDFGPVLVVPVGVAAKELKDMKESHVGLVAGDPAVLYLQNYPEIIPRGYPSISALLLAVAEGQIEGALLDRIPAASYVGDLFKGTLQISSESFNDDGLRLVVLKGKEPAMVGKFNKSLGYLQKKKKMKKLLQKWNLSN